MRIKRSQFNPKTTIVTENITTGKLDVITRLLALQVDHILVKVIISLLLISFLITFLSRFSFIWTV